MKFLLTAVGTRGDMEPFLALAEMLQNKGHDVVCLMPEQFRSLAESSGLRFQTMGEDFLNMLHSRDGKIAMGSGGVSKWKKVVAILRLAIKNRDVNRALLQYQKEAMEEEEPDKVVFHAKALYSVIWEVKNPGKTVMVTPVPYLHYVKGKTHLAFNSDYGEFFNKLTYKLPDWGIIATIKSSLKRLGESGITRQQIKNAYHRHTVVYTISPQLFARPVYWEENMHVLGYHERDKTMNWAPLPELEEFLARHEKPLLVTFGSMTNLEPVQKTKVLLEVLEKHQIPAIVNMSEGGLVEVEEYNRELICFVESVPYDWVLPKVYAMVHHGGSGTTHSAIKYGCPSLIIPHIIDQFLWNKIISEKGLGPKGVDVGQFTVQNIEPLILDLYNNETYFHNVQLAADLMKQENFEDELIEVLEG
ncbi:glycosyltransferase [Reichenbachiella versicolor]|uniref:glycosyltransferase n=1 Tax=Reichenbachiella versicolor TaxID=1821036 RepID=UPI000D6E8A3C|nr:glycosyltransferase [Reichenbachiella versicolor]